MNTFVFALISVAIVVGPIFVAAFCGWITRQGGYFRGTAFSWVVAIFIAVSTLAIAIASAATLWSFPDGGAATSAWLCIGLLWIIGGWFVWESIFDI